MQLNPDSAGDFFVIVNVFGRYWDGTEWVSHRSLAHRFSGNADPFAEAQSVADKLSLSGVPCNVAYVPPTKKPRAS